MKFVGTEARIIINGKAHDNGEETEVNLDCTLNPDDVEAENSCKSFEFSFLTMFLSFLVNL